MPLSRSHPNRADEIGGGNHRSADIGLLDVVDKGRFGESRRVVYLCHLAAFVLNGESVDALSTLTHADNAVTFGRRMCEKLPMLTPSA